MKEIEERQDVSDIDLVLTKFVLNAFNDELEKIELEKAMCPDDLIEKKEEEFVFTIDDLDLDLDFGDEEPCAKQ